MISHNSKIKPPPLRPLLFSFQGGQQEGNKVTATEEKNLLLVLGYPKIVSQGTLILLNLNEEKKKKDPAVIVSKAIFISIKDLVVEKTHQHKYHFSVLKYNCLLT